MPRSYYASPYFVPSYDASPFWGNASAVQPTIREAIVAAILADGPTTSIFGQSIFPLVIPEGTNPPALTYQVDELDPIKSLQGESGLAKVQVSLVARSKNMEDCLAATKTLRNLLISFRGTLSGIRIKGVFKRKEADGYDFPDDDSGDGTYSTTLIYELFYANPLPANQTSG